MDLLFMILSKGRSFCMSETITTRRRKSYKTRTGAARDAYNDYQREYRRAHPERVKRWREDAILAAAARIQAKRGERW